MKSVNRYGQPNLFLLRLWPSRHPQRSRDEAADTYLGAAEAEADKGEWHGTLRRITDGELYRFSSLPDLVDLLRAVVENTTGGESDEEAH
jgi:hypothetical protein